MRQLMAEHSQRRGQTGPPRDGERRADRQTVRKVMDAVSNGDHIGKQTLLWGTREDNDDIHSSFSGLMGRAGALWGRAQGHLGPKRGEGKNYLEQLQLLTSGWHSRWKKMHSFQRLQWCKQ